MFCLVFAQDFNQLGLGTDDLIDAYVQVAAFCAQASKIVLHANLTSFAPRTDDSVSARD